jgi:hypothetical protein
MSLADSVRFGGESSVGDSATPARTGAAPHLRCLMRGSGAWLVPRALWGGIPAAGVQGDTRPGRPPLAGGRTVWVDHDGSALRASSGPGFWLGVVDGACARWVRVEATTARRGR